MIDIETLGTETGSVILSIAAVKFNLKTGWHETDPFFTPVDIQSCLDVGMKIDGGALRFWLGQPQEVRDISMPEAALYLEPALYQLAEYLEGCTRFWAYGPMFDIAMLDFAYKAVKVRPAWVYRQPRCVRTILDLADIQLEDFPTDALHDPRADCVQQIRATVAAYKKLHPNG